ncbi:MAG: TonB-dependent receptor [Leadbetterella sp.]|nr:TonB-dependent receptor [Leadbetterella sp.]
MKLFLLFLFGTVTAFSQTSVRGIVSNTENREPLSSAYIYRVSAADSSIRLLTITDSLGRFQLELQDTSQVTLRIAAVGFESRTIVLQPGQASIELDPIYLSPGTTLLDAVVVRSAIPSFTSNAGNTVFRIAANPELTTTPNVMETLKRIPGLMVSGENAILMTNGVSPEVFIDGKPLHLNGPELVSYLQGLSPERVLSVELITNPPARYDGEFKAIIDIRLKKTTRTGWTAGYSGQLEQNELTGTYQNLNLALNRHPLQVFATFNYAGGKTIYRYAAFQHLPDTRFMTTRLYQANGQNNYNLQTGLEYAIDSKNNLRALVRYYRPDNDRERRGDILTLAQNKKDTAFHYLNTNPLHYEQKNLALTLDYALKLKNFQLDLLANRLAVRNAQNDDFLNTNAADGSRIDYWESDLKNRFLIHSLQADLSQKLKNWTVEGGIKTVNSVSANHLRFDVWNPGSESLIYDPARSNVFQYTEKIWAFYLAFTGTWEKLTLNGGLRTEHTRSVSQSVSLDSVVHNRYTKWLPSLSAVYTINPHQDITFSFSGRLTRPNFTQLNPFRFYFSVFNYWIGNPYLLPAARTQLAVSYRYRQFRIETHLGKERDVLARYPMYDSLTNEMAFLGANFPQKNFANVVISFPVTITPWWKLSYQFSGYYNKEKTPYLNEVFDLNVYNYVTRLNQTFSLPRNTVLNLLVNYESQTGNSLYIIRPMHNIDLSVQKTWIQGNLGVKLAFLDIFDTYRQYLVFRRKDIINNEFYHWWGARKAQLTLTYNLGNSRFNTHRPTVTDEEARTR